MDLRPGRGREPVVRRRVEDDEVVVARRQPRVALERLVVGEVEAAEPAVEVPGAPARVGRDDQHALATGDERRDDAGDAAAAAVAAGRAGGADRRSPPASRRGAPRRAIGAGSAGPRVAQDEPRLDRAVPLVDLEAERRVDRPVGVARDLPGGAERDGPGADAAGLDREADVPVLPHRARVAERRRRDEQLDRRVALAERRELLELLGEREAELVARDDGVDALGRVAEVLGQRLFGVALERGAERFELVAADLQPGGGAVAAVAEQVLRRGVQRREQVEARRRSGRSPVPVSPSSAITTAGRW